MKELNKLAYDDIVDFLLQQEQAKMSMNGKQVSFRCPFCGDSRKSHKNTNFSVKIDTSDGNPMVYQCFRAECRESGIVDQDFLQNKLGYGKYEIIHELNRYNKSVSGNKRYSTLTKYSKKELSNVITTRDEITDIKLKYINKRLGLDLDYKDIFDLKINLNFKELLDFNEIKITGADEREIRKKLRKYDLMNKYGIVFLSIYNDFAIVRDLTGGEKIGNRYNTENIFNNYESVCKYYFIPKAIDLLSPTTTVINVAEGCMDILSVYFNLDIDRDYENQIYAAAAGAGIVNLILHIIREYGFMDLKINIFSDSDVDIKYYNRLKNLSEYTERLNISIYYNNHKGEKDFGVPLNKIDYSKYKLI